MRTVSNPVVISGYEGEKYFCDRQQELAQLRLEIENGNNVALIASRRMGKSGLIQHYFTQPQLQDTYYFCRKSASYDEFYVYQCR